MVALHGKSCGRMPRFLIEPVAALSTCPMIWGVMWKYFPENFSDDELEILSRYFTNVDKPVFALVNLPEVVKGALFARYSRSAKSLRRLFLDEFYDSSSSDGGSPAAGIERAEALYERMLADYGDDSVAQLGGVHLACEQASNILTKVLERGRLMAYLEQSTRYVPYDKKLADGSFRYLVPEEIAEGGGEESYRRYMDALFVEYTEVFELVQERLYATIEKDTADSEFIYRSSIRAVALDTARGILPASVLSNVGIFGTAQAYEALILRMRASELKEVREYAELIKGELDKVIPAFLTRVDRPERGGVWVDYLSARNRRAEIVLDEVSGGTPPDESGVTVRLIRFDPDGERRIAAAIIFENSQASMRSAIDKASSLTDGELEILISSYVGERQNRRHKPGRAFEETSYLFEIECDYGAFRDLQRHRMLSVEWQVLDTSLGYVVPELIEDLGFRERYAAKMESLKSFHDELARAFGPRVSAYAVPMAYRIRFTMNLNAREALHLIELRSSPQGHSSYRAVAQEMYSCIKTVAKHANVAAAMKFVDLGHYRLGRLSSLRHEERKNQRLSR